MNSVTNVVTIDTTDIYRTDRYIEKNPSLHIEDSILKIEKIWPLVTKFVRSSGKKEMTLLDVGGGAGLILKEISRRIETEYGIKVAKIALDLSPGALTAQQEMNPDLSKALNEDIRSTSLADKEVDLTLMVDVIEHVPSPELALKEVKRISKYVIFKLPLEDNLYSNIANVITRGKYRRNVVEQLGHINYFDLSSFLRNNEEFCGETLDWYFENSFEMECRSEPYKQWNIRHRLPFIIGRYVFKLSPRLCSLIFTDHVIVLTKCYDL